MPRTLVVRALGVALVACGPGGRTDASVDALAVHDDASRDATPGFDALDVADATDAGDVADGPDAIDAVSDAVDSAPDQSAADASDAQDVASLDGDALVPDAGDGSACSTVMDGRVCYTACDEEYVAPDGGVGVALAPCEVYCDPVSTACYTAMGFGADCNLVPDGDGGQYVFC